MNFIIAIFSFYFIVHVKITVLIGLRGKVFNVFLTLFPLIQYPVVNLFFKCISGTDDLILRSI